MEAPKNLLRNIPNIISSFRILLVFIFAVLFYNGTYKYCLIIYALAFFSDLLDGYLARHNNWITPIGKLLDPLADKLMLITALVCFTVKDWIPFWVMTVIVIKELAFCIAGAVLYKGGTVVEANIFGKIATGLWTLGIILTLITNLTALPGILSKVILILAIASSFTALLNYGIHYLLMPKSTKSQ